MVFYLYYFLFSLLTVLPFLIIGSWSIIWFLRQLIILLAQVLSIHIWIFADLIIFIILILVLYWYHNSRVIIIVTYHHLIYLIILSKLVLSLNLHLISKLSILLLFRIKLILIWNLRWGQWIFLIIKEIQIKIIYFWVNSYTDNLWISFNFLISFAEWIASTILSLMTILPITLYTKSFWFLATMIPFFRLQCPEITILHILIFILILYRIGFYCFWSFILVSSLFATETCRSLIYFFIWIIPFLYLI